jgi:type II secretory pathway pseudopilin PulG
MKYMGILANHGGSKVNAFSLVEVTIAIGIFAFVMVGVLGLFPTATKMRADSAVETRAVMIAQQLFSYVESAGSAGAAPSFAPITFSVTNVAVRDGPALARDNTRTDINLTNAGGIVLGYQNRSSIPYYFFGTTNPGAWTNMPTNVPGAVTTVSEGEITTLARITATTNTGSACHQYRVTVEVRSPATASLTNSTGQTNPSLRIVQFVRFF